MKRFISIVSVVVTLITCLSLNSFAKVHGLEYVETEPSSAIIAEADGLYNVSETADVLATGLIVARYLTLGKTSDYLAITAKTICYAEVTKCGFTYIKLQRLINGNWTDYTTYCYTGLYSESTSNIFSKIVYPPKGYTYRVVCEHYAEKKKLLILKDKEKSYNVTSTVAY
ncbi:MAG: hypothetical protein NC122_05550 [Faecalibacterium sp.]|nr:hypothetical protein [Ruminococcus sp.]MCM1392891.1 hypothetical protein [Ruminococcus sp.]MCM1485652.1 hypothetical protein [Faecalibacterium sp.]